VSITIAIYGPKFFNLPALRYCAAACKNLPSSLTSRSYRLLVIDDVSRGRHKTTDDGTTGRQTDRQTDEPTERQTER